MSPPLSPPTPPPGLPKKQRGFALISVLGMSVLMTVVVAAMLAMADVSKKVEDSGLEQARARWIAQSAVAVALGQLTNATTQVSADGTPKPWTSQPGAIRVHAMDGTLEKLEKLYSSNVMEATSLNAVAADLPADWQAHLDDFVDLNKPFTGADGSLRFPIADPRAKTANPLTSVEGFDYTADVGAVGPEMGEKAQRLPMPVRWIYQRADGSLATQGPDGGLLPASNDPENPVIARFAFWTDDESCKVNINTAAEGAFWDTPRADTKQERSLAANQPTRREYEREPGHPAGVCLSSVLLPGQRFYPENFAPTGSEAAGAMVPMSMEDARDLWRLGRLAVAELGTGTSMGGTQRPDWTGQWDTTPTALVRQTRYLNVDELLFDTVNPDNFPGLWDFATTGKRMVHSFFKRHPEVVTRLPACNFFLTAHSSAPEVTLYGTPRIAMWPVHATTLQDGHTLGSGPVARDSSYDHKVAITCMLNGRPYFIQRSEPGSGGNDLEVHGNGANQVLLDYLRRLTSTPAPGFNRSSQGFTTFADKYGDDRDAILLQMLDYLRATNFADGQLHDNMQFSILCPGVEHKGFGQVSPLQARVTGPAAGTTNQPQGQGRIMTVSEVALMIVCRAQVDDQGHIQGTPSSANRSKLVKPGDRELEAGFLVEGFVPGQSWTDYRPYLSVALVGGAPGAAPDLKATLPKLQLNGNDLVMASNSAIMQSADLPPEKWLGSGGSIGVRSLSQGLVAFQPVVVSGGTGDQQVSLQFAGGSADMTQQLKLAVYDTPSSAAGGASGAGDLLHVIPLELPDMGTDPTASIPLPSLPKDTTNYTLSGRLTQACQFGAALLSSNDVVQSLAPLHGDYRLIAAQRWAESRGGSVATPVFVPNPQWGRTPFAHSLRDATIDSGTGTQGYINGLNYASASRPDMPFPLKASTTVVSWKAGAWLHGSFNDALSRLRLDGGKRGDATPELTGDYDNGIGETADGSYINRADDGHWAAAIVPAKLPYFDNVSQTQATIPPVSLTTFSAQRLLPSPVMFGSLPTGTRAQVPWQTLLFRPQANHYGAKSPPDHLLLDLFWSPVLEPEPLSQAFETAGKINLNYEMLPFRHITRATALHAAMKAETMMAIPDTASSTYKTGEQPDDHFRSYIDAAATVKFWKAHVFDQGQVFLTTGQLCEQPFVPASLGSNGQPPSQEALDTFWKTHRLTGDNTKERPYADLYSRLTTRSNTFRVHFIAQTVKQARSTAPGRFNSAHDRITASTRGNCLLQRHLDTTFKGIPDYQAAPGATPQKPLDSFYRWHCDPIKTIW